MTNIIYCEYCNWKKLTKNFSDLNIKEIITSSDDKRRKFRCPSCGRLIIAKKTLDPQKDLEISKRRQKQKEDLEKWTEEVVRYREEFKQDE